MDYGRLGSEGASFRIDNAAASTALHHNQKQEQQKRKRRLCFVAVFSVVLIVAAVGSTVALLIRREGYLSGSDARLRRKPTQAISHACSRTRFPALCVDSLLNFPGSLTAGEHDLVHISMNITLQHFGKALYVTSGISNLQMDTRVRAAYEDCLELLEESVEQLSKSLTSVAGGGDGQPAGSTQDVLTWLSAAMTNQDTCTEGFDEVSGFVKDQMVEKLRDLSELVSNCLAIFAASGGDNDFAGVPIQNRRRRRLMEEDSDISATQDSTGFPKWVSRRDRSLLQMPVSSIQADIIVSQDGNGTYETIAEAIKKAPENSSRRTIIYVKAGR